MKTQTGNRLLAARPAKVKSAKAAKGNFTDSHEFPVENVPVIETINRFCCFVILLGARIIRRQTHPDAWDSIMTSFKTLTFMHYTVLKVSDIF